MIRPSPRASIVLLFVCACAVSGCTSSTTKPPPNGLSLADHTKNYFPIDDTAVHALNKDTPEGPIACETCHAFESVTQVTCIGCHKHPTEPVNGRDVNATLHLGAPDFTTKVPPTGDVPTKSAGCYSCHRDGKRLLAHFPHDGITPGQGSFCAMCHDKGTAFDAFEIKLKETPTFVHQQTGGADCGGCHKTDNWKGAVGVPLTVFDPTRDLLITAQIPAYSGTTMVSATPNAEVIHMTMNHNAKGLDAGVLTVCTNCHAQAAQGAYYPGVMHWSLTNLGLPQPASCSDCHGLSIPTGFVGVMDSKRAPTTGPMKHDAVAWINGSPTATKTVTSDCVVCHQPPDEVDITATWQFSFGHADAGASYHPMLSDAGLAQPTSCIDCHANSRPPGVVTTPTMQFDHSTALDNCKDCHDSYDHWSGGRFHSASAATLTTCLPCHANERPTSTAMWTGTYSTSPFDYVTNALGDTHGASQDCAACHTGPGTGAWGVNQNWLGATFSHAPTTIAATTCIACHTTQRPDQLSPVVTAATLGFDHATSGTGDCVGCHQATVNRNVYVALRPIPGGDWRDGGTYPGASLITAPNQFVRLPSTVLTRSGGTVTGMTTSTVTLPNAMLHTSTAIPAAIFPGSASAPDQSTCWHCHTHNTATPPVVTAFSNGKFHAALTDAGLPQPTTGCIDCHSGMRPPNIVSKTDAGTWVQPMDHAAALTGGTAPAVTGLDCATCHHTPGGANPTQWSDGKFHSNLGTATPADCLSCHYPLMTLATADVSQPASGLDFTMKHRSTTMTAQACATCHTQALGKSTNAPLATTLWNPGALHTTRTATTQPTTCLDCHASSDPALATQGTEAYTLPLGGTATNGAQWMKHTDATVSGKDCSICHLADAKVSGSAWNKGTVFHGKVAVVPTCSGCHGTANGMGTVIGTNNNLPLGLTNSTTTTSSSAAAAPKPFDQINHADINVTSHDCNLCHTQAGSSTAPGVTGKEWAQAKFHQNFTAAIPLVSNGTTGRCSNCHLNVKPGSTFATDHSSYTATSGSTDCSQCHQFPGTLATSPNWLGASGAPHAASGATAASTLDCSTCHGLGGSAMKKLTVATASHYGGITNGNKCTSCHINFTGFKDTTANLLYAHSNATANSGGCVTCHAYVASVYTTLTTTPALTHPTAAGAHTFSQTFSVTGSHSGDSFTQPHTNTKLTLCGNCHKYSTTTATANVWTFTHNPTNPGISHSKSSSGCNNCH